MSVVSGNRGLRVAINLRQFRPGEIGGIENYVRNVLRGLDRVDLTIWAPQGEVTNFRNLAPRATIEALPDGNPEAAMEQRLSQGGFDALFCPISALEPSCPSIPSVAMVTEIRHEHFPEHFEPAMLEQRRDAYRATAKNADVLLTPSEHTRRLVIERLGASPENVVVIPIDADPEFRKSAQSADLRHFQELGLPHQYLHVPIGLCSPENHTHVLHALSRVLNRERELHLVLTGSPRSAGRILEDAANLGVSGFVRYAGSVNLGVVAEIYRNALALLFVTRFEDFGTPLIEAFHCNTPVITSNRGTCVELAGDAAVLVDPLNPESIADGIQRVMDDATLRRSLILKGIERSEVFSWERTADITAAVLERVAAAGNRRSPRITVEEWPGIGLVTPTYNMARFLPETIDSVLSQKYPHLDYVVIDGGSKDTTVDLLQRYGGQLRWASEKDHGQADAINKGYHATSGQIFGFLNADDTLLPGALQTVAEEFKRYPKTGLIYGEAYHVDIDGKTLSRYPTREFSFESLAEECYICQPAAFLLRDAFREAGMMDSDLHYGLDYDLWIRIAMRYPVRKIDAFLAQSRMHADNKTLSARRKVYQEIIGTVKRHYGYVGWEWLQGYSCYLLDGKDQFFDRSKPSLSAFALSLVLGAWHNPARIREYWADWRKGVGFGRPFTGRWEDGWISGRFEMEREITEDCQTLRVTGSHDGPVHELMLKLEIDGRLVGEPQPIQVGPFVLEQKIPRHLKGRRCKLAILANRTWRPRIDGDFRRLSCKIDSIELDGSGQRA